MDETHKEALALFIPYYLEKLEALDAGSFQFVQYTSAEAAMSILTNNEVWLRNAQCMNDYLEIEHGHECLVQAFHSEPEGQRFQRALGNVYPGLLNELGNLFDGLMPFLRDTVYIACFSEHPPEEDQYGRLSMWRAYGGSQSVALVFNKGAFTAKSDGLAAYSFPVIYQDSEDFRANFGLLAERVERRSDLLQTMGREAVKNMLFWLFKAFVLCVKHPGFLEEREWRVYYTPALRESEYLESEIVAVHGVPQEIYKISLRDIPEIGLFGVSIPDVLERILIGPSDQQLVVGKTFERLLKSAGCTDVASKIHYSGIPLR